MELLQVLRSATASGSIAESPLHAVAAVKAVRDAVLDGLEHVCVVRRVSGERDVEKIIDGPEGILLARFYEDGLSKKALQRLKRSGRHLPLYRIHATIDLPIATIHDDASADDIPDSLHHQVVRPIAASEAEILAASMRFLAQQAHATIVVQEQSLPSGLARACDALVRKNRSPHFLLGSRPDLADLADEMGLGTCFLSGVFGDSLFLLPEKGLFCDRYVAHEIRCQIDHTPESLQITAEEYVGLFAKDRNAVYHVRVGGQ